MIERLRRYVAIPSLSKQEHALADCVAQELHNAGLSVSREGNNVWAEFGDAPRPRLLLNSHLDTVPAGGGWRHDPWTPELTDGKLSGLGANDAKGCVTAMLEAVLAVVRRVRGGARLRGTLVLALSAEEENSGAGLGTIRERLEPLDAALVGEPTSLTPMIAQRGLLIVKGTARGRTAHPANTPAGTPDNAVVRAAADVMRLQTFAWGPAHPLLGPPHGHVTMLSGGVARNVIPDRCEFWLDVRTTPAEPHAPLFERLRAALDSELTIHSDRLVPVETPQSETIVRAVARALPDHPPAGSPAMSDMVFLAGIPAVKIGPGDTRRSHTPNEFLHVEELAAGAAAYERIICEYFAAMGGAHD